MPLTESQKQATVKYKEKNIKRIQAQKGESQSDLPPSYCEQWTAIFLLEDRITQSNKGANEYSNLN